MAKESKTYWVEVHEVYSGDDLVLLVDLGVGGLFKRTRARLRGVDTPSAFRASDATEAGEVRELLRRTIAGGRCSILLHAEGKGGWLVTLYVHTNQEAPVNVNEMLTERGYVFTPLQEKR